VPPCYTDRELGGLLGALDGEMTIDATERDQRAPAGPTGAARHWTAVTAWARDLAGRISRELPTQHISIFVPDDDGAGLRLAAQIWGAGEDTGDVVVGDWVVPLEGSICGRVYRDGLAALCADVAMDPEYRPFPGGRTRSFLTVPVGPPDGVVAVINLEAPWVGAFTIRDYETMTEEAAAVLNTFPVRPVA
jgi:hypothetical protein